MLKDSKLNFAVKNIISTKQAQLSEVYMKNVIAPR
jgi:hypothetical protein